MAFQLLRNDLFPVEPNDDLILRDLKAYVVPLALRERDGLVGLVHGSVELIDRREAHKCSSPATQDKAAVRIMHGKREATKKIGTFDATAFRFQLVASLGKLFSVGDPRQVRPVVEYDLAIFNGHVAFAAKFSSLPPIE